MKSFDYVGLTQRLVRLASVSGNFDGQRKVQEECLATLRHHLRTHAPEAEISVRRSPSDGLPWTLITTGGDTKVLFACHTDTVPTGAEADWSLPAFSGELVGGAQPYIHGRGSVDMKGGLAAAAAAFVHAAETGRGAGLLMTSEEEVGGLGAAEFAASGIELAPQLVVIPEATRNRYSRGHRGADWFEVTAHGRSAHGSRPQEGVNAIRLLSEAVINRLEEAPIKSDAYLGEDTLNAGLIDGGSAPNMVPAQARLTLDCRTVAGGAHLKEWLGGLHESVMVEQVLDCPELVARPVPAALEEHTDIGPVPYFTDGAMLQEVVGGAPIVVWGPGEDDQMHTVDERMLISSLDEAVVNYRRLIEELA